MDADKQSRIELKFKNWGSGCVAQLVERSLPISEVRGSNPVIGKNLFILNICFLSTVYWKDENKRKKEAGNGPFLKKLDSLRTMQCENQIAIQKFKLVLFKYFTVIHTIPV